MEWLASLQQPHATRLIVRMDRRVEHVVSQRTGKCSLLERHQSGAVRFPGFFALWRTVELADRTDAATQQRFRWGDQRAGVHAGWSRGGDVPVESHVAARRRGC